MCSFFDIINLERKWNVFYKNLKVYKIKTYHHKHKCQLVLFQSHSQNENQRKDQSPLVADPLINLLADLISDHHVDPLADLIFDHHADPLTDLYHCS